MPEYSHKSFFSQLCEVFFLETIRYTYFFLLPSVYLLLWLRDIIHFRKRKPASFNSEECANSLLACDPYPSVNSGLYVPDGKYNFLSFHVSSYNHKHKKPS